MPLQGMPGPYRVMEDYTGDSRKRWAGGMYAAPTEEEVKTGDGERYTEIPQYIAGEKGSADFGRRCSRRTTDKVICIPTWRTAKDGAAGAYHYFL